MSNIQFACPNCGAVAEIDGAMAGRRTVCPGCQSALVVPSAATPASDAAPFPRPVHESAIASLSSASNLAGIVPVDLPPEIADAPPVERPRKKNSILNVPSRSATPSPWNSPVKDDMPAVELGGRGKSSAESSPTPTASATGPSAPRGSKPRDSRRAWRNIIMLASGLTILLIVLMVLLRM